VAGLLQLRRVIHQTLGWALVVLLGPAPLASLLALTNEPACQMVCCDRKHNSHSCSRHHTGVPADSPVHLEASTGCQPGCSHAALGPSFSIQVLVPARANVRIPIGESADAHFLPSRAVPSAVDPSLYQRPPPLPA
jgi:hypothetical protein